MAFVIKFVKGVRNHWKKSTFLAFTIAYGVNYTKEYIQTQELMKAYCLEAQKIGDQYIPDGTSPKNVTVVLNPNANRRKAAKQFEKYCAPILHLAGICVDIKLTDSEGHARKLVEDIKETDAIIVAGGDGTVSEVITGLFRRATDDRFEHPCPIGILPLGQTNTVGRVLFPGGETLAQVKSLAEAAMAIIEETTKNVDVMKIEIIEDKIIESNEKIDDKLEENSDNESNNTIKSTIQEIKNVNKTEQENESNIQEQENKGNIQEQENKIEDVPKKEVDNIQEKKDEKEAEEPVEPLKPVYALATFEWGAYRDAHAKQDKYWYWGPLRKYATYVFNGYRSGLTWECIADINYLEPCTGCSNCYVKPEVKQTRTRWWSRFFSSPRAVTEVEKDYSKILNERCSQQHFKEISTSDFTLSTVNISQDHGISQLELNIGPQSTQYFQFVQQGFKTLKGENRQFEETIQARQIEIIPKKTDPSKEVWFSIDKEEYEVKPVRITLLPHVLKVFCRQTKNT